MNILLRDVTQNPQVLGTSLGYIMTAAVLPSVILAQFRLLGREFLGDLAAARSISFALLSTPMICFPCSLIPRRHWRRGKVAWYPLFVHAWSLQKSSANESYTWLWCGEITKLDIWLAVWQLCLCGNSFHYQRHKGWHDKDYAATTTQTLYCVHA